ncbi:MerC domain-containing protein [Anditalea andensis]|uniref:MerC mercury resistance protein n=1 Tax=Anditalea andensis TaxID=1048983 RepID=A0A074KWQ6_9BACT|nr:hypothetical protein EL17_06705 [Anditalea andensis]
MLHKLKLISQSKSDFIGISASIACIVHCLAAPALVSIGYIFNYTILGHWHILDYFFIVIAVIAVYFSTRNSPSSRLKYLFWIIVSMFSLSILLHERYEGLEVITLLSSIFLIILHYLHHRLSAVKKRTK